MKKIFALAMVVVMAFAFCACNKKGGTSTTPASNSFVGTWESTKVEYMGETVTGEAAGGMVFNVKADGTGNVEFNGEDGGAFTWTANGNTITITDEANEVASGELVGNDLVFNDFAGQGMTITCARK